MNKLHFDHVVDYLRYFLYNDSCEWGNNLEEDVKIKDLFVERRDSCENEDDRERVDITWWVCNERMFMFEGFATELEAEFVLDYIKQTEILFL